MVGFGNHAHRRLEGRSGIERALDQISGMLEGAALRNPGPTLRPQEIAGATVYSLNVPDFPMVFRPSLVVHDDHLRVSLYPQVTRPYIENRQSDPKLELDSTLVDREIVGFSYVDSRRQYELLYTYLAMGQSMMEPLLSEVDAGPDAEFIGGTLRDINLPSLRSVYRHMRPSVSVLRRDDSGLQATTLQTVPAINVAVAGPVGVGLLLPAVQAARTASRRVQSQNNLKQIALAMWNFESAFTRFPAAYSTDGEGKPLLSWRVHILPFLDEQPLYEQFHLDEPWDSEHNAKLIEQMPDVFRSPQSGADAGRTVYLGVGGEHGIIISARVRGDRDPKQRFPTGLKIAEITDGTSNTLLAIEASDEFATIWTKPEEFVPEEGSFWKLFGMYEGGMNAAFADGSVQFLSEFLDEDVLSNLFNRHDGNPVYLP